MSRPNRDTERICQELADFSAQLRTSANATIDKQELVGILIQGVRDGHEGVTIAQAMSKLGKGKSLTADAMKKALHDLGRSLEQWYETTPRDFRVEISSSGKVRPVESFLRQRAEQREESLQAQVETLLQAIGALPEAIERILPLKPGLKGAPTATRGLPEAADSFMWIADVAPALAPGLKTLDAIVGQQLRDSIAQLVLHHIGALVARHRANIIAVQRPSHGYDAWNQGFRMLDGAYEAYRKAKRKAKHEGRLMRFVVLPTAAGEEWWHKLWDHLGYRLSRREDIWAVPEQIADREFCPGLAHDILLLEDALVAIAVEDDEYGKHIVGLHPRDKQGFEIQKGALAAMDATQNNPNFQRCKPELFTDQLYDREALDAWLKCFGDHRPVVST